jgi:hypothetical protein
MKKIQVVIHEFDENGNETGRTIVSEIEPEKIDDIKNMTNKEKIEFLSRIEQKAIDSSTELKKTYNPATPISRRKNN